MNSLANVALFGGLSRETVDFLLERADRVEKAPGEYFFREDEMGDCVYVLEEGSVVVEKSRDDMVVKLAELGPGDCFGEMALVAISPRCATVRALQPCTATRLRNAALFELYGQDVEQFAMVQMNMGREIARRLRVADDLLFEHACAQDAVDRMPPIADMVARSVK